MLTATTIHQGWSKSFNINIIAAGTGGGWWSSGSGIYSGGNALKYYYNTNYKKNNILLIAVLPILKSNRNIQSLTNKQTFLSSLNNSKFVIKKNLTIVKIIDTTPGFNGFVQLSSPNVFCTLKYSISEHQNDTQTYSLVIVEGYFSDWIFPMISCGLYACPLDQKGNPKCGSYAMYPMTGKTLFNSSVLETTFSDQINVYPIISKDNMQLFHDWNLKISKNINKTVLYSLNITIPTNLIQLSLLGRFL